MPWAWPPTSATAIGRCWLPSRVASLLRPANAGKPSRQVRAALLLRFGRRGPGPVVGVGNAGQFLDECRNRPDLVVLGAGLRKARHACHVDAVLDYPEQLGRGEPTGDLLQVR